MSDDHVERGCDLSEDVALQSWSSEVDDRSCVCCDENGVRCHRFDQRENGKKKKKKKKTTPFGSE